MYIFYFPIFNFPETQQKIEPADFYSMSDSFYFIDLCQSFGDNANSLVEHVRLRKLSRVIVPI